MKLLIFDSVSKTKLDCEIDFFAKNFNPVYFSGHPSSEQLCASCSSGRNSVLMDTKHFTYALNTFKYLTHNLAYHFEELSFVYPSFKKIKILPKLNREKCCEIFYDIVVIIILDFSKNQTQKSEIRRLSLIKSYLFRLTSSRVKGLRFF